jgi:NADH-quinone oxidoreductase subunit G
VLTDGIREHANVVFPADSYAEKEGTVVHPDGRVQRLRRAIAHPGTVRAGWSVLAEIAKRAGLDAHVLTSGMAFSQLVEAVPFYAGLTLDEIAGPGIRWPEREAAQAFPAGAATRPVPESESAARPSPGSQNGALRLGTYRPIWASPEVDISPALQYTVAHQQVELSPEDATALGIASGEAVQISQLDGSGAAQLSEAGSRAGGKPEGTRLDAKVVVRSGITPGTVFLADGIATDSANSLTEPLVELHKR